MGMTASAILATKIIVKFRPRLVLMVGIAGGVKGAGVGFGDVLIADQTVDYGSGKVSTRDGKRILLPGATPLQINSNVLSHIRNRETTADDCHEIEKGWIASKPNTRLSVHVGTFGTNDVVVDDAEAVDEISSRWRKLVAVEMETHAVHRACRESVQPPPRFLAIKSASDLANQKTNEWRPYAAYTAAEFASLLICNDWEHLVN
jgi:nucleoside phosphorylase